MSAEPPQRDPTRRTLLAAERTWLAWWRTAIATSTAAIAIGGVVPRVVGLSLALATLVIVLMDS